MDFVEIGGLRIAYRQEGQGRPVVFLHGILDDSRSWYPQFDGLSSNFIVIAWDAPGCGESSDPPEEGFGSAEFADCLASLIIELSIAPAAIVGVSWGGALALEVYNRHPELVSSLVLADTYAGWKGSLPQEVVAERLASCIRESAMPPEDFIPGWIPGLFSDAAPQSIRDQTIKIMSEFHPVGYRVMVQAFANLDLRPVLPTIHIPTLLIWGEEDRRSPLSIGQRMSDSIPEARLVVIPHAGHASNVEQPKAFNAAICEFLLEHPRE